MYQNPRRLRRPEDRVGNVTNADLPPPDAHRADHSLGAQLRAPDHVVFDDLASRVSPTMLGVAMQYVQSREVAEEVVQQTWLAALAGLHRFEGRASFKTWLFRILVNQARTRARREQRVVSFSALASGQNGAGETESAGVTDTDVASHAPDPEQQLLNAELRAVLETAVNALPTTQRLVLSMRDIEGRSADEVGELLKLQPGNQRVILHRARMKVREIVMRYMEDLPADSRASSEMVNVSSARSVVQSGQSAR